MTVRLPFSALLLALALLSTAACSSTKQDPAPVVAPAPTMTATQLLIIGKWTLQTQAFRTQPALNQSQTFVALYSYPATGPSATTFEFKAGGTADYIAGTSVGGPGPGASTSTPYKVTGELSATSSAYITLGVAPGQILNINILTDRTMVIDKRTFYPNGSADTEQRLFVR